MNNFNNTFITNWKDLSTAQIGFEFEFFSNFSYIKTLELLNLEFQPIEVWGFNQYHSSFEVTDKAFKIEPDYSGGSEMIELITGKLPWIDARVILIKMFNFIKEHGYTDEHCSVHVNISFDDVKVYDINLVKLILSFNEDFVYDKFPARRGNIYARTIKWIMPFEDFENSEAGMNNVIQSLILPTDTKYYGINLQKKWEGYLEYRYIGGADYENKLDDVLGLTDYFVMQTKNAITQPLIPEDNVKLLSYLEDNINWFKQYRTYNEFLSNIDGIRIEIDKDDDYTMISSGWDKFKKKLFEIVKNIETIKNATINYNSTTSRLEIIGANLNKINYMTGVDFIECQISECTLYNCDIVECHINNGHIYNSNVYESKIENAKLNNCQCLEYSELLDCLFDGGLIDCKMVGGVFRSGQFGDNADIDLTVKMSNKDTFWQVSPKDKTIKDIKK